MLIGERFTIEDSRTMPHYPTATSFLPDTKDYLRYAPEKAFDGDPGTSWVENHPQAGIGAKIAFILPKETTGIAILPGYGDSRYFELNNRVKRAKLTIYILGRYATQYAIEHEIRKTGDSYEIEFDDAMELQEFSVDLSEAAAQLEDFAPEDLLAVLEVLEVYPGSKWDDTCIAEIQWKPATR